MNEFVKWTGIFSEWSSIEMQAKWNKRVNKSGEMDTSVKGHSILSSCERTIKNLLIFSQT